MTEENDNNIEEQIKTLEHLLKMAEKVFNQKNEEDQVDVDEWAEKLSKDLSKFND